jgi:predicted ribosome quality control (RQC) complex YloA/Tae2 family protein
VQPAQPGAKQKLNPEIEETENSIKKQQKLFEQNKIELQAAKDAGETIFRNMQLINAVLAAARENKNITLDRLQEMFPEIKVLSVDLKKKTIDVEL